MLSIAAAGTFVVLQAQEDTGTPDCSHCETVEGDCSCNDVTDDCMEDCDNCDECNGESADCSECDSGCDDCISEKEEEEEVFQHCGGCH